MANQLKRRWNVDMCQKGFLILMATESKKFWVARDVNLPIFGQKLTQIFQDQVNLWIL